MKSSFAPFGRAFVIVVGLLALWAANAQTPFGAKSSGASAVFTSPQVRAELMAHAPQGVEPGQPFWVGLQLIHQPQWHTYWKNSGDSGKPTELLWTLPSGLLAGQIDWPVPHKIPVGNMANYGYDGTVLLPVSVVVPPGFKPSPQVFDIEIRLRADWLVCRKECIPEGSDFTLRIPLHGSTALNGAAFEAALGARPHGLNLGAKDSLRVEGQQLKLSLAGLPDGWRGKTLEFFPEVAEVIETAAPWSQSWNGATWSATVPLSAQRLNSPKVLPVVLAQGGSGYRAEMTVQGKWPPVVDPLAAADAAKSPAGPLTPAASTQSPEASASEPASTAGPAPVAASGGGAAVTESATASLGAALLGALLGGLILNLMPCVFPVLAIKLISFSQHAGDGRRHRISGMAYSAGVVLSFVALGALMLTLRAAGESLGWGFQLQNPWMVAALAALFTVLGLNLAGMFEFGQVLPSAVASLQARHPALDALLTGVLAVAVASPCTAPFMGASLGLAASLPTTQALLVFAVLGLGMALPYLAASLAPGVARLLPRPGAWMQSFRQLMAFPMFATVVWLVWVLGQQSGLDGAGALLAMLVALSAVVWALTQTGRTRWVLTVALGALFVWVTVSWAPLLASPPASPTAATAGGAQPRWQVWSQERVVQLVAAKQPVFVDFTAAWCVTCQYNKKTTLSNAALLSDMDARKVQMLRADWTRQDPAITAALAALGRNGVPVYVLHRPGKTPLVLSEVLSVDEVRAALATL
jgi:thiol:disulfide interchange protein DsbD